jgi:hypothetical protein
MLKTYVVFRLHEMPQEVKDALLRMWRDRCYTNGCFVAYREWYDGNPKPGSDRSIVEAWLLQSPHLAGIMDGVECPDVLIHYCW